MSQNVQLTACNSSDCSGVQPRMNLAKRGGQDSPKQYQVWVSDPHFCLPCEPVPVFCNPSPPTIRATQSDLHPPWAGTNEHMQSRALPPVITDCAAIRGRVAEGSLYFPASLSSLCQGEGGEKPGRKKKYQRCPHCMQRGDTGLLHSDKLVRHREHLLQ